MILLKNKKKSNVELTDAISSMERALEAINYLNVTKIQELKSLGSVQDKAK